MKGEGNSFVAYLIIDDTLALEMGTLRSQDGAMSRGSSDPSSN